MVKPPLRGLGTFFFLTCCRSSRCRRRPTTRPSRRRPARRCRRGARPPPGSTQTPRHGSGRCRRAAAFRSRAGSWRGRHRTGERRQLELLDFRVEILRFLLQWLFFLFFFPFPSLVFPLFFKRITLQQSAVPSLM